MVVSMSEKEFSRLSVLMDTQAGRLRIDDAARLLKLKRRQIFRLLKGLRTNGAASLASKRRGRTSNNKLPDAVRELTMALVKERYADFGPTLAAEKLRENHACLVSRVATPIQLSACILSSAIGSETSGIPASSR